MTLMYVYFRKRMQAEECLKHRWLSQDVTYMIAKRLSKTKHKKFLARRKWQVSKRETNNQQISAHKLYAIYTGCRLALTSHYQHGSAAKL